MADSPVPSFNLVNGCVLHAPIELATGSITCWRCKKITRVVAVIVAGEEGFEEGVSDEERCETYVHGFDEDDMPPKLEEALVSAAPNYRPTYSGTMQETTWANQCEFCGELQGAFYLHMEPDGPFFGAPADFFGERTTLLQEKIVIDFDED